MLWFMNNFSIVLLTIFNAINKFQNQRMGAGLSRKRSLQNFFPNFTPSDWVVIPEYELENRARFGESVTLRNKITKQEIDKYEIYFQSERQQRIYEECFMKRLRQQYLVNAFHYQPIKNQGFCSAIRGAVVYIQHIPIRLSDVTDIPFEQSLYILKSSLLGFQKLYQQSGYFQVMEEHIGINKNGHIKVWLNADLSKNYPYSFEDQGHQSIDYERVMVGQILQIIEKNTNFEGTDQNQDSRLGNISISTFMERSNKRHPSFQQCHQILQRYIDKYHIQIPKRCKSVIQIFEQKYGDQFNITDDDDFLEDLNLGEREDNLNEINTKNSMNESNRDQEKSVKNEEDLYINGSRDQGYFQQYQPLSPYRPIEKRKKNSDEVISNKESRQSENNRIRLSIKHSQKSSNRPSDNENDNKEMASKQMENSGLYGSKSENSNLYRQIGEDFNKICGDSSKQPSNNSSSIQKFRMSKNLKNYVISQNPTVPKITFTYNSPIRQTETERQYDERNISQSRKSSQSMNGRVVEEFYENENIERQFIRDLQKEIHKQNTFIQNENQNLQYKKHLRLQSKIYNNRIEECDIEQDIDPEIMNDILMQFPEERDLIF